MFNRSLYNPAFAGGAPGVEITFAGRTQWVGIDGAPQTFALVGTAPSRLLHGGIGAYLVGDQVGPFNTTEFKVMYSYQGRLNPTNRESAYIHVGINGGLIYKTLDGTNWRPPQNPNDPVLINEVVNQSAPDIGAGLALIGPDQRYYISVAANHLLEPALTNFTRDVGQEQSRIRRAFVASAGFKWFPDNNVVVQPSILYRRTGPNSQFELNTTLEVSPLVLGVAFRQGDAFGGILGMQINEKLFVAYSYDYTVSDLAADVSGSHEILLTYRLPASLKLFPGNLDTKEKYNNILRGRN